ncbi:MAG: hypothetical protein RLZZ214_4280 [Verrucomicrobiota bacterium]
MNRNFQLTLAWFFLAFLVTGGAIWQAQIAVAREVANRQRELPPPLKTRSGVRPAPSSAPVADYASRRAKGLTDREIGWIVEDFQTAGLDLGIRVAPKEAYLAQRKAQDRWYHAALVDAWSLTPEQAAQVAGKLAELYNQAKADFIEALTAGPRPFEHNGKWYNITSADPIHRLIDANLRLQDPAGSFLPWNLCKMAPERHPDPSAKKIDLTIRGTPAEASESVDLTAPVRIATATPSLITVDQLLPQSAVSPQEDAIQVLPEDRGLLAQLRKLHPVQLKLLLLIAPEKVREIQSALDAPPIR